ncbi:MAG: phage/plasmid primase, P4 family [Defluviicoccus sp.]|nr:phage/plasmid primase, P4 family [Defluviicoccus sp.]
MPNRQNMIFYPIGEAGETVRPTKTDSTKPKKRKKPPRAELSEIRFADEFHEKWNGGDQFRWRCENADWRSGRFWNSNVGWVGGDVTINFARDRMANIIEVLCALEPIEEDRKRSVARWCSNNRIAGALTLAASKVGVIAPTELWDADPEVIGLRDATKINLRHGARQPQVPDDLIARALPVLPDPDCPTPALDPVLDHMSGGEPELRTFYQIALGMSMYGHNEAEKAFFWYGAGASGKSTLMSAVLAALGPYGARLNRETLEGETGQHLTFVAQLTGARIAVVAEMEGEDLRTGRFKALVGGDEMMVNRMRQDPVPFRCVATIHAMANPDCLPSLRQIDESIRRRIVIVPAGESVPKADRDPQVKRQMTTEELPGIAQWLLDGAKAYHEHGLTIPARVQEATDMFFIEASPVGRWIKERCEIGPYRAAASHLFIDFSAWYRQMGFRRAPLSMQAWGRALSTMGYERKKSNGKFHREGLRLQTGVETGRAA